MDRKNRHRNLSSSGWKTPLFAGRAPRKEVAACGFYGRRFDKTRAQVPAAPPPRTPRGSQKALSSCRTPWAERLCLLLKKREVSA